MGSTFGVKHCGEWIGLGETDGPELPEGNPHRLQNREEQKRRKPLATGALFLWQVKAATTALAENAYLVLLL
jgi:hypothetical protein